jgi:hypothetical protein
MSGRLNIDGALDSVGIAQLVIAVSISRMKISIALFIIWVLHSTAIFTVFATCLFGS